MPSRSSIYFATSLAFSMLAPAYAQAPAAVDLDLPAGPLGESLNAIAAAGHRSLTVAPELVRGLTAPPVRGRYDVEQAMRLVLAPSGLRLVVGQAGDLSVERAAGTRGLPAPAAAQGGQLAPVTVVGQAEDAYQAPLAASPKFTAALRDTPRTVSVVPKAVIEDTGSTSLQDAMRTLSGITFAAGEGGVPIATGPSSAASTPRRTCWSTACATSAPRPAKSSTSNRSK